LDKKTQLEVGLFSQKFKFQQVY